MATSNIPIIDAHVHVFPESQVATLNWCTPDHPLANRHSLEEYTAATADSPPRGFVYLEADQKHDDAAGAEDGSGWENPLKEVAFIKRVLDGKPLDGEGHAPAHADLCKAVVPWAPLASGPAVLERYIDVVKKEMGDKWSKVKGFRYLLQDKPSGTGTTDDFIASLKLLGRLGLVFDLGIDQHSRGRAQMEEAVELIERAHEDVPEEEKVTFIINHMCKPDLTVYNTMIDTGFISWRTAVFAMSKGSKTYMKLSGGFPEMTESMRKRSPEELFEAMTPWLLVLLAAFGPSRLMFGSDWPVCTAGVGDDAWAKWKKIVDRICYMASYEEDDIRQVFGGTACRAYGIEQ